MLFALFILPALALANPPRPAIAPCDPHSGACGAQVLPPPEPPVAPAAPTFAADPHAPQAPARVIEGQTRFVPGPKPEPIRVLGPKPPQREVVVRRPSKPIFVNKPSKPIYRPGAPVQLPDVHVPGPVLDPEIIEVTQKPLIVQEPHIQDKIVVVPQAPEVVTIPHPPVAPKIRIVAEPPRIIEVPQEPEVRFLPGPVLPGKRIQLPATRPEPIVRTLPRKVIRIPGRQLAPRIVRLPAPARPVVPASAAKVGPIVPATPVVAAAAPQPFNTSPPLAPAPAVQCTLKQRIRGLCH